jgi:diguanylate cyclase (GGDEF)-like protein
MYAQWIAAISIATWFTPHALTDHPIPDGTLLLIAFVCGGVVTMASALAVRLWNGERRARIILAICQMLMSSIFLHLTQGHLEMNFHVYGSLAFLAFYADWTVLAAASAVVLGDQILLEYVAPTSLFSVAHSNWVVPAEGVKLLLCDAFLLWSGRERVRESRLLGEQQQRQRELLHRAFHDSSTGLPNRAALEAQLDATLERGDSLSCLYLEIEGLTDAHDLLGLAGGDTLTRSVVARMQDCVHHDDRLGRISMDKFVIVVDRPHTRPQLEALAESIVRSLAQAHNINGRSFTTGVSIGIASTPIDALDRESLLAAADRTMYTVRCDGRNHYRFACDLRRPVDERNTVLSSRLQRALLEEQLHLVYQPIFTTSEQMVAVEALCRWTDPDEGLISPCEFIPVAEANGLIVPLSNWVLMTACRQMVEWVKLGTSLERVAVNVSVKHIWRGDFVATVEQTLLETGLKPSRLELEVTESALAADLEAVKQNLQALRKLGVRISIDDFGTGYSSLSRVRELDADTLKVDRTFVQGAAETPNGVAVVQAIVDMAHTLKLSVVAEGVETAEQLQMLRNMRCDEVQGFLLARPQSPEILTAALKHAASNPRLDHRLRLVQRLA